VLVEVRLTLLLVLVLVLLLMLVDVEDVVLSVADDVDVDDVVESVHVDELDVLKVLVLIELVVLAVMGPIVTDDVEVTFEGGPGGIVPLLGAPPSQTPFQAAMEPFVCATPVTADK
jgi:hypothetical protein